MAHRAHILLGDANEIRAAAQKDILSAENYNVIQAKDLSELLSQIHSKRPEVLILGGFNAEELGELVPEIRGQEFGATLPILVYLEGGISALKDRSILDQVEDVLDGEPSREMLLSRLPLLIRMSTMHLEMQKRVETAAGFGCSVVIDSYNRFGDTPFRVMHVDPDGESSSDEDDDLNRALIEEGLSVRQESNVYLAGDRMGEERFEACLVRLSDPEKKEPCLYLCSHLRDNPRLFNMPVLLLDSTGSSLSEAEAIKSGATVFLSGAINPEEVALHVRMLVGRQRFKWNLRDPILATLSPETGNVSEGTYSEEFFGAHLKRVLATAQQRSTELVVCVFDIPTIREIRERYDSAASSILSRQLASWIKGLLRVEDTTAKLAEDRFGIILPDTNMEDARSVANRIVGILQHSDFRLTDEITEAVQVKVNLSLNTNLPEESCEDLMRRTLAKL